MAYESEQTASDAIPIVAPHQRMWEPEPYRCAICPYWHIGNTPLIAEWPLRTLGATLALARHRYAR